MNPILYLIAKFKLFFAKCITDKAKRDMRNAIDNTKTVSGSVNTSYDRFIKCAVKQEECAVALRRLKKRNTAVPILDKNVPVKGISTTQKADIALTKLDIQTALARHRNGDWGDITPDQWNLNNRIIKEGIGNIISCYKYHGNNRFYINTHLFNGDTFIRLEGE